MGHRLPFGAWLRRERKTRRLTQEELGKRVLYSKEQIRKIETGQRRFAQEPAERLAEVLGIPEGARAGFIAWARGELDQSRMPLPAFLADRPDALCAGAGCNGEDPETTGCSAGAITAEGVEIRDRASDEVVGTVELRFSRVCQANWVRITRLSREGRSLRAYLRDQNGNIISATQIEVAATQVYAYGPMWYAPTGEIAVQACGVIDGCDEVCTNHH